MKRHVQPIGGAKEKVEGWYDVCERRGLTSDQGVMIPAASAPDLMLRVHVIQAVREGRFHVWAVASVDEGIEVLTGQPASEVHAAAKTRSCCGRRWLQRRCIVETLTPTNQDQRGEPLCSDKLLGDEISCT